jgi:hypothetical protein
MPEIHNKNGEIFIPATNDINVVEKKIVNEPGLLLSIFIG